jgi:hypothetical protein
VPAKLRSPKQRRPSFSAATLQLFQELELTPKRKRPSQEFRAKKKELMCRHLGLVAEFWGMASVLDDSSKPHHPPHLWGHTAWVRCREVRRQLLQALAESLPSRDAEPARAPLVH